MCKLPTIETLQNELDRAHKKDAIEYYHIGKVPNNNSFISEVYFEEEEFDVYIGVCRTLITREDQLRIYLRKKYGHIIRVLVIEPYG